MKGPSGDERGRAAFTSFVRAREVALVRLGWALTGDRQSGEDLAQATLDRVWARWDRIVVGGDPWPYTQRVAASIATKWRMRHRYRREVVTADPPHTSAPADAFADAEQKVMVTRWMRALPPRQRAVISLRFLLDLSVEEVAVALGVSGGTVKSQTAKALRTLRDHVHELPDWVQKESRT